jgi:hypothetical protein
MPEMILAKMSSTYDPYNTLSLSTPAHSWLGTSLTDSQRIILVGGFGDSEYLRKSFRSKFGLDGKIAITVPDSPYVFQLFPFSFFLIQSH